MLSCSIGWRVLLVQSDAKKWLTRELKGCTTTHAWYHNLTKCGSHYENIYKARCSRQSCHTLLILMVLSWKIVFSLFVSNVPCLTFVKILDRAKAYLNLELRNGKKSWLLEPSCVYDKFQAYPLKNDGSYYLKTCIIWNMLSLFFWSRI